MLCSGRADGRIQGTKLGRRLRDVGRLPAGDLCPDCLDQAARAERLVDEPALLKMGRGDIERVRAQEEDRRSADLPAPRLRHLETGPVGRLLAADDRAARVDEARLVETPSGNWAVSDFAEQVVRVNRGRVFRASAETLGSYVLRDYVSR